MKNEEKNLSQQNKIIQIQIQILLMTLSDDKF
jgi:hypothetical protein